MLAYIPFLSYYMYTGVYMSIVRIVGQINDKSFSKFARQMDKLRNQAVQIELYSEGGDEDGGLAFHGKIKNHLHEVTVTVHGNCNSAALAILAAADIRQCTPEATFLVHDSTITITGTISQIAEELKQQEAAEHRWDKLMANASSKPPSFWREVSSKSTILTAEDALKYGLIHTILDKDSR